MPVVAFPILGNSFRVGSSGVAEMRLEYLLDNVQATDPVVDDPAIVPRGGQVLFDDYAITVDRHEVEVIRAKESDPRGGAYRVTALCSTDGRFSLEVPEPIDPLDPEFASFDLSFRQVERKVPAYKLEPQPYTKADGTTVIVNIWRLVEFPVTLELTVLARTVTLTDLTDLDVMAAIRGARRQKGFLHEISGLTYDLPGIPNSENKFWVLQTPSIRLVSKDPDTGLKQIQIAYVWESDPGNYPIGATTSEYISAPYRPPFYDYDPHDATDLEGPLPAGESYLPEILLKDQFPDNLQMPDFADPTQLNEVPNPFKADTDAWQTLPGNPLGGL